MCAHVCKSISLSRSSCTVLDYEVLNHIKLTKIRTTSIRFELWQIAKPRISVCACVRVAILCIAFLILLRCWHSTFQNLLRVNTTMYRQTYQEYLLTTVVSHRAAPVCETSRVGWFTPWVAVHFFCCFHYPSPLLLLSTKANTHNLRTREWVAFAGKFERIPNATHVQTCVRISTQICVSSTLLVSGEGFCLEGEKMEWKKLSELA